MTPQQEMIAALARARAEQALAAQRQTPSQPSLEEAARPYYGAQAAALPAAAQPAAPAAYGLVGARPPTPPQAPPQAQAMAQQARAAAIDGALSRWGEQTRAQAQAERGAPVSAPQTPGRPSAPGASAPAPVEPEKPAPVTLQLGTPGAEPEDEEEQRRRSVVSL